MTATSPAGSSRHYCGAEDRATHRLKRINRAFEEACTGRPKDRSIVVARDRRKGSSSKSGGRRGRRWSTWCRSVACSRDRRFLLDVAVLTGGGAKTGGGGGGAVKLGS
jgi:hypothetical protein